MTAPHPAPDRERVNHGALFAAFAAGPGAWIVQLVADSAIDSVACTARRVAGDPSGVAFGGETTLLLAINLVCLAVVVAGGLFCRVAWGRVADEKPGGPEAAMTVGDSRTRFIAVCGMMSSVGFALAVLFNTVEPLIGPGCWTGAP